MSAAYRNIPIDPTQRKYLVVSLRRDCHFIDKTLPWGLANAAGLEGEIADAVCDILHKLWKIPHTAKWVDDFQHSREPVESITSSEGLVTHSYAYNLAGLLSSIANLKVPWSENKMVEFCSISQHIGFEWDSHNRTVSFSDKKLSKYRDRVSAAFNKAEANGPFHLKEMLSIHGTLMHLTFVIREGRPFLRHTQLFMASFSDSHRFQTRRPSKSVVTELRWWCTALSTKPVRALRVDDLVDDVLHIWVDASSDYGIGIVIDGEWLAWTWSSSWDQFGKGGYGIGWAEMIAIELVVRCLVVLNKHDRTFFIRSDNNGAIDAIRKGCSRNVPSNDSIIRINSLRIPLCLDIKPSYVASKDNLADPVSRGDFRGLQKSPITFELPAQLAPCLLYV